MNGVLKFKLFGTALVVGAFYKHPRPEDKPLSDRHKCCDIIRNRTNISVFQSNFDQKVMELITQQDLTQPYPRLAVVAIVSYYKEMFLFFN